MIVMILQKHPFIKLNLCVPTIPIDPSVISNDNSNNIVSANTEQITTTASVTTSIPSSFSNGNTFKLVYNTFLNYYEVKSYDKNLEYSRNLYIDNTNEWRVYLGDTNNYGKDFGFFRDSTHNTPVVYGVSSEGIIGVPGSGIGGYDPYVAINLSKALEGVDTDIENIQSLTHSSVSTSSEVNSTYGGSKLFDNNAGTYWATAHSAGYHMAS